MKTRLSVGRIIFWGVIYAGVLGAAENLPKVGLGGRNLSVILEFPWYSLVQLVGSLPDLPESPWWAIPYSMAFALNIFTYGCLISLVFPVRNATAIKASEPPK